MRRIGECRMLQKILDDKTSLPAPGECHLASLTATDRVTWANARKTFFSTGLNKTSLDTIEKVSLTFSILINYQIYFLKLRPLFTTSIDVLTTAAAFRGTISVCYEMLLQ